MDQWQTQVVNQVGGCTDLVRHMITQISLAKKHVATPSLRCSKGILLYGKPGIGKTALALTVAKYSELPNYVLNAPDIFQAEEGVSEARLLSFFDQAKQHKGLTLLILDEIDMLMSKWTSNKSPLDMRIASLLMSLIDQSENVFLMGLTNRLHAIEPAFLRSGRLDDLQEIMIQSPKQRYEVLMIITRALPFISPEDREDTVQTISKKTHGFVPSDLQSLCSQATLLFIKQKSHHISLQHFESALTIVKPSNLNEFASKIPHVSFTDIFGLDDTLQEIKTSVIQPFHAPERYMELGISPPKGILVHGPTGVGKTMLCSALASEAGVNFMLVESSQIRSKVVGESEKGIAKLFAQARANAPCILFIDQIDMLLPKRGTSQSSENTSDRIVTGFLTEMDGLLTKSKQGNAHIDLLVVAATNRIEAIDPAVLRPGRFDEHVFIPLPDKKQRHDIIQGISLKMPIHLTPSQLAELVENTANWSGAQLDNLFREAAMASLREDVNNTKIEYSHVTASL